MKKPLIFTGLGAGLLTAGALYLALKPKNAPLPTVASVDLQRYAGKWYEIAAFPQRFEKGCHCTFAEYTPKEGYVEVRNTCRKGSPAGKEDGVVGKAFPVEGSHNAKLRVQFFWPFRGDYWILALADDYSHALVGTPDRDYLWILSRAPQLDSAIFARLSQKARELGFDTRRLVKTDQSCNER
ncbi:lipocalin family protein [Rufibacter sediminis]|uniref:Lipocalin family protein n=1 Tax=Rufibacter sediminis TaxID=2762756 RepID=A0ABR6VQE3_9BACT|nr:lipocalin family protein [Rufibacter sediminis]MBC3539063.1 lipocalin family protein [Rufibacter sediminis]